MRTSKIKPVSYIWQRLLQENSIPRDGVVIEVAPGYEKKIGDALAFLKFRGTVILIEPDEAAAKHVQKLYKSIMPSAKIKVVTKFLQDVEIGRDVPLKIDALLANHPFDDMAIAFAMHDKRASFFSQERKDGVKLTPSVKEIYDSITDKDYIHGILATVVAWKEFVEKLKPGLFIASQYPSHKLTMKNLTKRQNSGFIVIEMLRDYYENFLKRQFETSSFGEKGDPAWWIIAKTPFQDIESNLLERPEAMDRLGKSIFVSEKARKLGKDEYEVVYSDKEYFKSLGYKEDAMEAARAFAIVLDKANSKSSKKITVYADRQKDSTEISLSGNLGSGRAVYYGKNYNIMGVGKTSLCKSLIPSHSTGRVELVGSLRRVILSRWVDYFTKNSIKHPVVIALKETSTFKWSRNPIPLSLLVRVDDGALDRPSHVEYDPAIKVDFEKVLDEYARLDAGYFSFRMMLGAWSTGNYSLRGHIIDLETASFVKYRGPYNTASAKHYQTFFGYEGAGFVMILEQLARIKGIKNLNIEKEFYEKRRRYLAQFFLSLLGIDDFLVKEVLSKYEKQVLALSNRFERLAKKISPKKSALSLYSGVSEKEDPCLLDISGLFRELHGFYGSPKREEKSFTRLIRASALNDVESGASYETGIASAEKINQGEEFIKNNAVITRGGMEIFLSDVKRFVKDLFHLLDILRNKKLLPEGYLWDTRLRAINQDFPTFAELNEKLKYWVEEYRLKRVDSETLSREIEKLCLLPNYPTGELVDLKNIPLIQYLKPAAKELETIKRYFKEVAYKEEETIIREGEEADSLFLLVQGTCKVMVDGKVISKISDRGALIGEAVMFEGKKKRTASVIAQTPARLLRVSGKDLEKIAVSYPKVRRLLVNSLVQRQKGISDRIRNLKLFDLVNAEETRLFFADKAVEKFFQPGEELITQDKKVAGVYLLSGGSVILNQSGGAKGNIIELTDKPLEEGLFGERSVIFSKGAVCTVTANGTVTAFFIAKNDFLNFMREHPKLLHNCLTHISEYSLWNKRRGSLLSKLSSGV